MVHFDEALASGPIAEAEVEIACLTAKRAGRPKARLLFFLDQLPRALPDQMRASESASFLSFLDLIEAILFIAPSGEAPAA
jgi:hypothetical protein